MAGEYSRLAAASPDDLLVQAAVVSVFDVDWLRPHLADDEVDEMVDFLSSRCERVVDSTGAPRWQLRDDERIRVLRQVPRPSLRAAMNSVATRPNEPVQAALEGYLSGSLSPLDQLDAAGLSGVLQLERWVGEAAGLPAPDEVQARLDWLALVDPLRRLVARGFFGRQDLLAELRSFIEDESPPKGQTPAFLIEGVGGSGKSTVLARLILDLPANHDMGVYLSFDRGWLIDGGPWALFDEIVRQIGAQLPERRSSAHDLRQQAQRLTGRASGYSEIASRSSQRRDPVAPILLERLATLAGEDRRLVVVLDTLEELGRRDESLAYDIFGFLGGVSSFVAHTRVIAAGRWLPSAAFVPGQRRGLTGLDEADALRLLQELTADTSVRDAVLREVVKMLGGNPLSLQLAADVLKRTGQDPTQLIAVAEGNVQGQLYARLLEHIRDPQVQAVAHPGLVVRRLTPEIIRVVLAEPCGIGPLSEAEAERIFWALRDEATLCEPSPDGDNALVHRQDVRMLMLPSIQHDRPGTTRAIHEAAVRYYEAAPGSPAAPVPEIVARREELYHRLMLKHDRSTLDQRWVPGVAGDLTAVIEELPPRSQLYLTTKVPGLRLDPAARADADDDEWRHAVRPAATLRMERGQVPEALKLVRERRAADGHSLLPELEIEALERLGRLDAALGLANEERLRAEQRGAVDQVRTLISLQGRILERMRRWPEAWTLLENLAVRDRERRARTTILDDQIRARELIVLTSMLRIAKLEGRSYGRIRRALSRVPLIGWRWRPPDRPVDELIRETMGLVEQTPQRLLTANPSLLRDLAAELGPSAPQIVQLAASALGTSEEAGHDGLWRRLSRRLQFWHRRAGVADPAGPATAPGVEALSTRFSAASEAAQNYLKSISYLALRSAVGFIAILLPFVLALTDILISGKMAISVSNVYNTSARDVLVGGLCAIGALLFTYVGYDTWDKWLTNAAGVFAIGAALFPAAPVNPSSWARAVGYVHLACFALLFIIMAIIALWLFRKTQPGFERTPAKKRRDLVYLICGIVIAVCVTLIPVASLLTGTATAQFYPLFWLESTGIIAFGIAWLVKGQAVLRDRLPQPSNVVYARTISYLTLRKLIGWIGVLLVPALATGNLLFSDKLPGSVSGYYYTSMRNVLVGSLCALGVFLFMYFGYDRWDNWLTNAAGVSAVGAALFPAAPVNPSSAARAVGYVHLACFALLFTMMAIIALWLFRRTQPGFERTPAKRRRDLVYQICGIVIVTCLVLTPIESLIIGSSISPFHPLFWLEATATFAFGLAWLVKGQVILKDRQPPSAHASVESARSETPAR
jgi:hypothetical protein